MDVAILMETWLNESSSPCLDLLVPPNYNIVRFERPTKVGGGIAYIALISQSLNWTWTNLTPNTLDYEYEQKITVVKDTNLSYLEALQEWSPESEDFPQRSLESADKRKS